ncbi:MAG: hypothetical protein EBZ48_15225, partial [Proteobacteria bacterium]|nr:hypothetical protein [Pseudomonadota bacterium]
YSAKKDIRRVVHVIVEPEQKMGLDLSWLEHLRSLERAEVRASSGTTLESISAPRGLTAFLADDVEVKASVLSVLAEQCPELVALAFRTPRNPVPSDCFSALAKFPNLRFLRVHFHHVPPPLAFNRLRNLEVLDLTVRESNVGTSQALLSTVADHPSLNCLIINSLFLGGRKSDPFRFTDLKTLPRLETLVISSKGGATSNQGEALRSLEDLTQVRSVWIRGLDSKQEEELRSRLPDKYKGSGETKGSSKGPSYSDFLPAVSSELERIGFDESNKIVFMPPVVRKQLTHFQIGEQRGRKLAEILISQVNAVGISSAKELYEKTAQEHIEKAREDIRQYPNLPVIYDHARGFLKGFDEAYKYEKP